MEIHLPSYWRQGNAIFLKSYTQGIEPVPYLLPEIAVNLPHQVVLDTMMKKIGREKFQACLNPENTVSLHHFPENWMQKTNMVGVNIRTIGTLLELLKYALTLPEEQDSIHLLPIWEPGVVSSLYGKVSWGINPEFYSSALHSFFPHLDNVEKQLKVAINLLHALGKKVGMDVIPHCDRFAEMVFVAPSLFEWVKRNGGRIERFGGEIHKDIEQLIWEFLVKNGTATGDPLPASADLLFEPNFEQIKEHSRQRILFGEYHHYARRLERRRMLIHFLAENEYETLPMTMAPPYRGLKINSEDFIIDEDGHKWYTYEFLKPQEMSRVFGPLTRYRFYETQSQSWELDFNKPVKSTWDYLAKKYADCQSAYNMDFMRGDMAHVQPRPTGVPQKPGLYYDPLRFIKNTIQEKGAKSFAFFAETFLTADDYMLYGSEPEHLDAIQADVTLGDLQSTVFGSLEFREKMDYYHTLLKDYTFKPCFTVITSDKDDPRFDVFYQKGNIARYFMGIFMPGLPSYMSLGFETRTRNLNRVKNEQYTKLYVFKINDPSEKDKCTFGPYEWNQNHKQFLKLKEIHTFFSSIKAEFDQSSRHTLYSNILTDDFVIWHAENSPFIFAVCLKEKKRIEQDEIMRAFGKVNLEEIFTMNEDFQCKAFRIKA